MSLRLNEYIVPKERVTPLGIKALRAINDPVNRPAHYTQGPACPSCGSTIECITITRERNFAIGNAIKYLWRAGLKGGGGAKQIEDLEKAVWYIQDELNRLTRGAQQ